MGYKLFYFVSKFKLTSLILSIILVYVFVNPLSSFAETVIRVGVYDNPPKIFMGEDGKPEGIFIDIIEDIAKKEGWKLVYVEGTWADCLKNLSEEKIDLMPDVAHNPEREKLFRFHKVPVLSSWSQVYASKDSKIQSILDLKGKRVFVLDGSAQQTTFKKLVSNLDINVNLIPMHDYDSMFKAVAKGEGHAAITNRFYGQMNYKMYKLEDTAVIFDPATLYFAGSKGIFDDILNRIDLRLTELKQDSNSEYYESIKKWTFEKVEIKILLWIWLGGSVILIILFVSIVGSVILKREVNIRTRELQIVNKEMEKRIIDRTAELAKATEKAQEADRIKSAFLATMSHELRTPLNSIIGFTGIMLQGLAGPLNAEQHKQLSMVQNSSRHLLNLINDVLDISKIEAGELTLYNAEFNIGKSIEKLVGILKPIADKKHLELRCEISSDSDNIVTDQRRFEQIILNLANNAIKFTESGYIEVDCIKEGDHYKILVIDTGIGIENNHFERLFSPFYQVDSGLTRKSEGTGLGLSITKKLLDMMGGKIDVESELGKGSKFTILIPITDEVKDE